MSTSIVPFDFELAQKQADRQLLFKSYWWKYGKVQIRRDGLEAVTGRVVWPINAPWFLHNWLSSVQWVEVEWNGHVLDRYNACGVRVNGAATCIKQRTVNRMLNAVRDRLSQIPSMLPWHQTRWNEFLLLAADYTITQQDPDVERFRSPVQTQSAVIWGDIFVANARPLHKHHATAQLMMECLDVFCMRQESFTLSGTERYIVMQEYDQAEMRDTYMAANACPQFSGIHEFSQEEMRFLAVQECIQRGQKRADKVDQLTQDRFMLAMEKLPCMSA